MKKVSPIEPIQNDLNLNIEGGSILKERFNVNKTDFIGKCQILKDLDSYSGGGDVKIIYQGEEIAEITIHKHKKCVLIKRLGVKSPFRKLGLATTLMKIIIKWCDDNKIKGITVHVSAPVSEELAKFSNVMSQEQLINFYRSFGFDKEKGDWMHRNSKRFSFFKQKDVFWD